MLQPSVRSSLRLITGSRQGKGRQENVQEGVPRRPSGNIALAVLTTIGGVLGLLAGLYMLLITMASGGVGLVIALVTVVVSVAELAFAYGTWTLAGWALRPGARAVGFAVAIAIIILAAYVGLTIPVSSTVRPA